MIEQNLQKNTNAKAYSVVQSLKVRELGVHFGELFTLDPQLNFDFPGGHIAGVTPVPIPNTEVKPR